VPLLSFLCLVSVRRPACSTLFPYTTLFRSSVKVEMPVTSKSLVRLTTLLPSMAASSVSFMVSYSRSVCFLLLYKSNGGSWQGERSEEHTSELQSRENLVCRLLLEKKKKRDK